MKNIYDWIIYKITSPSGKIYIGKTRNLKKRFGEYKSALALQQSRLRRSFLKHGFESHCFSIEDEFQGDNNLSIEKEIFWIDYYKSNVCRYRDGNGLNLTDGGEGCNGYKMSDELKKKLSERGKCDLVNIERLKKLRIGIPSYNKGKKFIGSDEERKKRFSIPHIGHTYNKGRIQKREVVEARIKYLTGKANPKKYKPILQFDLEGNLINEYISIQETKIKTKLNPTTIHACLNGTTKNPRFFVFKYKNVI